MAHRMCPEGCPGGNIVMDSQIDQADFEQLLSRLSETGLDSTERKGLALLIESDQSRRQQYLEYCQIHAILRSEHGLLTAWSPPSVHADEDLQGVVCKLWRWRRRVVCLTPAGRLPLVGSSGLVLTHHPDPPLSGPAMAV